MVMVASGVATLSPVFAAATWWQFRYWASGWTVMGILDAVEVQRVIGKIRLFPLSFRLNHIWKQFLSGFVLEAGH